MPLRRLFLAAAGLALVALALFGVARQSPALYPAAADDARWVAVVDHGWHAGLVVSAADLRAAAVAIGREDAAAAATLRRLAAVHPTATFLEIGWGEAAVYRQVRRLEDLEISLALRALLLPTPSVLHVVPLAAPPAESFRRADRHYLALSDDGFAALARGIAETAETDADGRPQDLGPGLYGGGRFYAAEPRYSLLHTCNHWIAGLLRRAGVPASWATSALSSGLMAELAWRTDDRAL
ncbi:MAG: DUF2459 domain-containing protein [Pseudomonadota bacterium]